MPDKRITQFICTLLFVVTLAVYWPAAHFDFTNYDDPDYVTLNPAIQHGITAASLAWAFKTSHASNWHPLTWISHMTDYSLYGPRPGGHHLTSLLLHSVNAVLLFLAMLQLTASRWRSALVAALFAWHPLHVESVAWISERKDVLSACFWFLTMLAYTAYARTFQKNEFNNHRKLYYLLALLCCALGLLCKPMVVTLPFALLLLDYWPLRRFETSPGQRSNFPRLLLEKIPFLTLALLDAVVTFWAQKNSDAVASIVNLPLSTRVGNALVSYVLYLWKMVWPINLAVPYPYSHLWTIWQIAGALLLLALISVFAIVHLKRQPSLLIGWLWFLGTLVPAIGLVQVGIQSMADRYTYLPLIGIFIIIAWSIPARWAEWPRPGLVFNAITICVLAFLLMGAETQLQYWRNSITLFSHAVDVTQNNILAEYNLAEALARNGDTDAAIAHYQQALAITPNRVEAQHNSQTQSRFNLGLLYRARKQWPEAAAQFRACVEEEPRLLQNHANLGVALMGIGQKEAALRELRMSALTNAGQINELLYLERVDSALAETGHIEDAIVAAQKTREAALVAGKTDVAAATDQRIQSYRASRP